MDDWSLTHRIASDLGKVIAIELRRHFAGIRDNGKARECVRTVLPWNARSPAGTLADMPEGPDGNSRWPTGSR